MAGVMARVKPMASPFFFAAKREDRRSEADECAKEYARALALGEFDPCRGWGSGVATTDSGVAGSTEPVSSGAAAFAQADAGQPTAFRGDTGGAARDQPDQGPRGGDAVAG